LDCGKGKNFLYIYDADSPTGSAAPAVKFTTPLVNFTANTEKPAKGISQVCFMDYFI
jgi:hypothetical protein